MLVGDFYASDLLGLLHAVAVSIGNLNYYESLGIYISGGEPLIHGR